MVGQVWPVAGEEAGIAGAGRGRPAGSRARKVVPLGRCVVGSCRGQYIVARQSYPGASRVLEGRELAMRVKTIGAVALVLVFVGVPAPAAAQRLGEVFGLIGSAVGTVVGAATCAAAAPVCVAGAAVIGGLAGSVAGSVIDGEPSGRIQTPNTPIGEEPGESGPLPGSQPPKDAPVTPDTGNDLGVAVDGSGVTEAGWDPNWGPAFKERPTEAADESLAQAEPCCFDENSPGDPPLAQYSAPALVDGTAGWDRDWGSPPLLRERPSGPSIGPLPAYGNRRSGRSMELDFEEVAEDLLKAEEIYDVLVDLVKGRFWGPTVDLLLTIPMPIRRTKWR